MSNKPANSIKKENELSSRLEEYTELLELLCKTYDSTQKEILALSISVAIRVLVHDTRNSTSLMKHLDKKDMDFLSSNTISPHEKVHLGLVRRINVGVNDGQGGEAKYWPLCDERYFPCDESKWKYMSFNNWWGEDVFKDNNFSLTREDLVLAIANKDGGAHFDSEVEERYDNFRHNWSGGSTLVGNKSGVKRGYDNIPIYPAIRQIGYELIKTIQGE